MATEWDNKIAQYTAAKDWDKVAYYNALKTFRTTKTRQDKGLPTTHTLPFVIEASKKYGEYNVPITRAYNDIYGKSGGSSGGRQSPAAAGVALAPSVSNKASTSDNAPKPELNLPSLTMSEGASVLNQFNKLRSKDSVLKQQAIVDANERGVAGGKIHSAQQAGAVERSIEDRLIPLAQAEASLVASTDINNWQNNVNQYMTVYQAEFTDYLKDKGYDNDKAIARMTAETSITTALMDNIGRLLNNPDLDLGAESYQKLIDPYNAIFTSDWFNYT